jgi:hypothetical protein
MAMDRRTFDAQKQDRQLHQQRYLNTYQSLARGQSVLMPSAVPHIEQLRAAIYELETDPKWQSPEYQNQLPAYKYKLEQMIIAAAQPVQKPQTAEDVMRRGGYTEDQIARARGNDLLVDNSGRLYTPPGMGETSTNTPNPNAGTGTAQPSSPAAAAPTPPAVVPAPAPQGLPPSTPPATPATAPLPGKRTVTGAPYPTADVPDQAAPQPTTQMQTGRTFGPDEPLETQTATSFFRKGPMGRQLAANLTAAAAKPEGGNRIVQQVASYVNMMTPEEQDQLTPEIVNRLAQNAQNEVHNRAVSRAVDALKTDKRNPIASSVSAGVVPLLPFVMKEDFEHATRETLQKWGLVEGQYVLTEDGIIYEVRY